MGSKEDDVLWRPSSFIDSWGTYVKDALDFCRKYGAVNMSQWGGSSAKTYTGSYNTFYANASNMKIAAYWNLGGANPSGWKDWLANNGPVVVRFDMDRQFERVGTSQVVTLDNFVPGSGKGHAVCLVGYRLDGSFIVRNSWGKYWGDGGHVYVTENYARAAFDEAYGITL
jgi:C1A family cysteine protease